MIGHKIPRTIGLLCALACAALPALPAHAAESGDVFPSRALRVIVPFPAGSGADAVLRPVAQRLAEQLAKPVVVENRPGGGTVIGMNMVAKAAPDGYTLLLSTTSLVITPALVPNMPFDPVKDLAPLVLLGTTPLILLTSIKSNITTVKELIEATRARPDGLSYSSSGNGAALHLGMELLNTMIGAKIRHIPYKGSPEALHALASGDVDVGLNTLDGPVVALVNAGKVRAIGMSSRARLESMGQVPTVAEAGIPGYEVVSWHGMLAPAKTPPAILARLESEIVKALQSQPVQTSLKSRSMQIQARGSAEFAAFIAQELQKWTPIVKASGAKMD